MVDSFQREGIAKLPPSNSIKDNAQQLSADMPLLLLVRFYPDNKWVQFLTS